MVPTKPGQIIYFLEYYRNCRGMLSSLSRDNICWCFSQLTELPPTPPLLYPSLRISYIYLARRREMVELVMCPIAFIYFLSSLARVRQVNPEYFL